MATTFRVYFEQPLKGRTIQHFDSQSLLPTGSESVQITACEYNPSTAVNNNTERLRFVGLANVWISNISPLVNQVYYVINVDWGSPVYVAVDITIGGTPNGNPPIQFS